MQRPTLVLLEGAAMLASAIIGAGFLSLPYVARESGIVTTLFWVLLLGLLVGLLHVIYGDIVVEVPELHRLPGYVRLFLGRTSGKIATASFLTGFVVLLIYLILAAEFLAAIFSLPASSYLVLALWAVLTILVLLDIRLSGKAELAGAALLFVLFIFLVAASLPRLSLQNLSLHSQRGFFLPYGPALFSLLGLAAIPEISFLFRKEGVSHRSFRRMIFLVTIGCAILYLLFTVVMLGRIGGLTTPDTIRGLAQVAPRWVVAVGGVVAFLSVVTSYLIFGISIKNTLASDFRLPPLASGAAVSILPIAPILLGFHDFFLLIRITGGILSAVDVTFLLLVYNKLHRWGAELGATHRRLPAWALLLVGGMVIVGGVLTLL